MEERLRVQDNRYRSERKTFEERLLTAETVPPLCPFSSYLSSLGLCLSVSLTVAVTGERGATAEALISDE
jgi:hypothetical protein